LVDNLHLHTASDSNRLAAEDLPRVLVVHNYYQQPGGEDQVVRAESALLRSHGHAVRIYSEDNRAIAARPPPRVALETVWSAPSARKLGRALREFRPDIVHFHNTFPLISPSAYYACEVAGVAVVQTVHHYRWGCPKATLYRDGRVCEDCLGKRIAWPAALHGCYHGSRPTSAVIGAMNAVHRVVGTWRARVDRYIALSDFQRDKLVAAGLPAALIDVKGNFVDPDPGVSGRHETYMLFVGRLVPEKGIDTLLRAWRVVNGAVPLKVVGSGPLAEAVSQVSRDVPRVEWLGQCTPAEVQALMGEAAALLVPSEWHEPFGLVAIEAFARGTPVIAARSGALPEIVVHGKNGLLYPAGTPEGLLAQVRWAAAHPAKLPEMGRAARQTFERYYTADSNYARLVGIYQTALNVAPRGADRRQLGPHW
jgi:glycosyltransferase involved in cell wall biosynthesis